MPAFHVMLPVRDEADIIEQSLHGLLKWADEIHIFDTGSVDNTWELIQDISSREPRVRPLLKDSVYFNDVSVRGWIFETVRSRMFNGDWFLRTDADEFHHISPKEFVATRMERYETIAYHQYYNFVLRESDVESWNRGTESLLDRHRPIEERRRWYQVSDYSEPRLCRYRKSMKWPSNGSFPCNAGFVARERLPIRHYPHRDPVQLRRRCRLRAMMMSNEKNCSVWNVENHHWVEREWRKFIVADGQADLIHWIPDTPFEEVHRYLHLAPQWKRKLQLCAHSFLLPLLDAWHSNLAIPAYPEKLTEDVRTRIEKEMSDENIVGFPAG